MRHKASTELTSFSIMKKCSSRSNWPSDTDGLPAMSSDEREAVFECCALHPSKSSDISEMSGEELPDGDPDVVTAKSDATAEIEGHHSEGTELDSADTRKMQNEKEVVMAQVREMFRSMSHIINSSVESAATKPGGCSSSCNTDLIALNGSTYSADSNGCREGEGGKGGYPICSTTPEFSMLPSSDERSTNGTLCTITRQRKDFLSGMSQMRSLLASMRDMSSSIMKKAAVKLGIQSLPLQLYGESLQKLMVTLQGMLLHASRRRVPILILLLLHLVKTRRN